MNQEKKIKMYDVVKLTRAIPKEHLVKGDVGTVVLVHDFPPIPIGFEVEFLDREGKGQTLAVLTLEEKDIELHIQYHE